MAKQSGRTVTIQAYLQTFVNFEQNNWVRPLSMAKFVYNNAIKPKTGHTPFKLNCSYYLYFFFEKNTNSRSKSKLADKLFAELRKLMIICQKNLHHTYKLQKQAYNKSVKPKSYTSNGKVWLNI